MYINHLALPRLSSFERYLKAHPTCRRCGEPATVVDFHLFPKDRSDAILFQDENRIPSCRRCHSTRREKPCT